MKNDIVTYPEVMDESLPMTVLLSSVYGEREGSGVLTSSLCLSMMIIDGHFVKQSQIGCPNFTRALHLMHLHLPCVAMLCKQMHA